MPWKNWSCFPPLHPEEYAEHEVDRRKLLKMQQSPRTEVQFSKATSKNGVPDCARQQILAPVENTPKIFVPRVNRKRHRVENRRNMLPDKAPVGVVLH